MLKKIQSLAKTCHKSEDYLTIALIILDSDL